MLTPSQVRLLAGSPAHHPRLSTDSLFLPPPGSFQYTGPLDEAVRFIQEHQLLDAELWARFVRQFRTEADKDLGWRCEYWGKLMRGGSLIYSYTQDSRLYRQLEDTLRDMLTAQDPLGRFSCYPVEVEFQGWDLWGRKYILLARTRPLRPKRWRPCSATQDISWSISARAQDKRTSARPQTSGRG